MTVYLDMDGVLADFFGKVEEVYHVDHWKELNMDVVIAKIQNTNWFYKLETFPTAKTLVAEIDKMTKGDWGICSSPLRGDTFNSAYWKRVWLTDMALLPEDLSDLVFTQNKHKYTKDPVDRRPNILIDDKPENVERFNAAGGIGIRFQANQDDLEEYLFVELDKAIDIVNATPKSSI